MDDASRQVDCRQAAPARRAKSCSLRAAAFAVILICGAWPAGAAAQAPLLLDVHTIVGGDAATQVAPYEGEFTIAQGAELDLTLTDVGFPAPFAALKLIVTRDATVVATADAPSAAPVHFSATAGTYVVRVAGALVSGRSSGTFGVHLVRSSGGAAVLDVAQALSLPPGALPTNVQTIDTSFAVAAAGDYDVTLVDAALPQALTTLSLLLTQSGASSPALTLNGPTANPVVVTGLQPGTYRLLVVGQSAGAAGPGAFGVRVRAVGGPDIVNQIAVIGQVTQLGTATLPACTCVLTLTDFHLPAALTQGGVAILQGGAAAVARATLSGGVTAASTSFTAPAGEYQVLAYAVPATPPGSGTYGVDVRPQGANAATFGSVQSAGGQTSGTTPAYSFDVDVPSAGNYLLRLADFQFPQGFSSLSLAAVQNAAIIGALNAAATTDTISLSLAAGKLSLLVAAQPGGTSGALFGIDLAPAGGGVTTYATTQGVGGAFRSAHATLPAAGNYDVALLDLGFPANFSGLYAVVTQGATRLGSIYGGGSFHFAGSLGDVVINVLAQPAQIIPTAAQRTGTYAISVAPTPPPTVTLSSSMPQVQKGDTVTLTWSSSNATACTASGGWSGSRALSGSATSVAIDSTTTFTLDCSGDGGAATQSVTVTVAPQASGGGGAIDYLTIAMLCAAILERWRARRGGTRRESPPRA
jgi:hypothetical protein